MKRVFVIFCCLTTISPSADYVVSPFGDDAYPGTLAQPFKTIQKAAAIMIAGDVCMIRGGVYRETMRPTNSGTKAAPLTFVNYGDEQVVITGLDVVVDWQKDDDTVWKAACNQKVTQVFIDGALADWARFPNASLTPYDQESWAEIETFPDKRGQMSGIAAFGSLREARVVALCGSKWITVTGQITTNSGESFAVNPASAQWSYEYPSIYLGKGKGYLVNSKKFLDAPNEWFYTGDALYLIPPGQSDPNVLAVEARVRDTGANLDGKRFIHLRGLHFKAANITMRDAEGCVVDGCSVRYPRAFFTFTNGFNRDDKDAAKWSGTGVEVAGFDNTMRNCTIAHSWGDGVTMWGVNNTLENCLIEDCDWMAVDCAPLCATGEGHLISHNTLRKAARSILVHRHLAGANILYNHMHDCGLMTDDLGLTYSFQTDGGGTIIAYNWVHDNNAPHTGPGIYLDNGDANYLVHHNVVWNCGEGIRLNLPQTNTDVFNNTFWKNLKPMGAWPTETEKMEDCRMWNNIQNHSSFIGNDQQKNLYAVVSMFVDPDNGDFRLLENAPAIDYGVIIPGITDGYIGTAPDAGAYEYGSSWTAGSTVIPPSFDDSLPTAPTGFKGIAKPGRVELSWNDNAANEQGFAIDRRHDIQPFAEIGRTGANQTTFIDSTVVPLKTYTYRIRAYNGAGSNMGLDFPVITSLGDGSSVRLEAEAYNKMSGIANNGNSIGSCDNGDYVMFTAFDFGPGFDLLTARCTVPAEYAGQKMLVKIDKRNGATIAALKVQSTGGWDNYQEQSTPMERVTGVHDLYFVFSGSSGIGNFDWFQFSRSSTIVAQADDRILNFYLAQNYPNPFNPTTTIDYQLPSACRVTLQVFDIRGRLVETVVDRDQVSGHYSIQFSSPELASGAYFYKLTAGNVSARRKMMLIH